MRSNLAISSAQRRFMCALCCNAKSHLGAAVNLRRVAEHLGRNYSTAYKHKAAMERLGIVSSLSFGKAVPLVITLASGRLCMAMDTDDIDAVLIGQMRALFCDSPEGECLIELVAERLAELRRLAQIAPTIPSAEVRHENATQNQ